MELFVFVGLVITAQGTDGGGAPANDGTGTIEVDISEVNTVEGKFFVTVHDKKETFPIKGDHAVMQRWVSVSSNPQRIVFTGLKPGWYAVGVAQDSNGNGKIDTGWFGIPSEPVGVSRNPRSFGPPRFDDCKVFIGAGVTRIPVTLR